MTRTGAVGILEGLLEDIMGAVQPEEEAADTTPTKNDDGLPTAPPVRADATDPSPYHLSYHHIVYLPWPWCTQRR